MDDSRGWIALVGIATFILAFAMSTGILFWIIISEIFHPYVTSLHISWLFSSFDG
jgi:hypothetical protein